MRLAFFRAHTSEHGNSKRHCADLALHRPPNNVTTWAWRAHKKRASPVLALDHE